VPRKPVRKPTPDTSVPQPAAEPRALPWWRRPAAAAPASARGGGPFQTGAEPGCCNSAGGPASLPVPLQQSRSGGCDHAAPRRTLSIAAPALPLAAARLQPRRGERVDPKPPFITSRGRVKSTLKTTGQAREDGAGLATRAWNCFFLKDRHDALKRACLCLVGLEP
jgi:hypothetical protein